MKSSQQIAARIKHDIEHATKFPKMWFRDAESMELHMMFLTNLLSFIYEIEDGIYSNYLFSKGYQSNNFSNSMKTSNHDSDEIFIEFIKFFKEFYDNFQIQLN